MTDTIKFKRYDTCDTPTAVLKLTRAGHYLWHLSRKSGLTVMQQEAISEALEILWKLKREVKTEIADRKKQQFKEWRARR